MANLTQKNGNPTVKRRLATTEGCLYDLSDELPMFFKAFEDACKRYNQEILHTPPEARCRGFEAILFNSKLIQGIQTYFPDDWKFGKYKRFIFCKKGYLVLFKKLNSKGMPMNIKTKMVDSINYQMMESLFDSLDFYEEPILYFGYKKDRIGNIYQPQLVYIDENKVRWSIDERDVEAKNIRAIEKPSEEIALPKLKTIKKKAMNE